MNTHVYVISDLHLGGQMPTMMSRPESLAAFIHTLPDRVVQEERLELVIAGDFLDFLAIPPLSSWTPDPIVAAKKIDDTISGPQKPVFAALRRHVSQGHRLTIVVGNHDVELVLPSAQAAFLNALGADLHQVLFVDDGRAYRVGGALIEHGNRYDGANENDWDGLRSIASSHSRHETPLVDLEVSAGSQLVEKMINPLKVRYPFLDLLQPQGELTALLLLAFEPAVGRDWPNLVRVFQGAYLQGRTRPVKTRQVAAEVVVAADRELDEAFGEYYRQLHQPSRQVSAVTEWLHFFVTPKKDSLAEILRRGEPIPRKRLQQIQLVLRRLLLDDRSLRFDGPTAHYGEQAQALHKEGVETVIMGHTHLARHLGPSDRATYLNTGTWADLVRVPPTALLATAEGLATLEDFLHRLHRDDGVREFHPTYADLVLDATGQVVKAQLCHAKG